MLSARTRFGEVPTKNARGTLGCRGLDLTPHSAERRAGTVLATATYLASQERSHSVARSTSSHASAFS